MSGHVKKMALAEYMRLPLMDWGDPNPTVGQRYRWGRFRVSKYQGGGMEMVDGEMVMVHRWEGYEVHII